jgi:hypothetical protein
MNVEHDTSLHHQLGLNPYSNVVNVAVRQRLAGVMLTDDLKLGNAPTLAVPVLRLPDV